MQRAGWCFASRETLLLLKVCADRRTVKQDPRAREKSCARLFTSSRRDMGFFDKLFGRKKSESPAARFDLAELSRRLGIDASLLSGIRPEYRAFSIPKRSGGVRQILAPVDDLKNIQRLILRKLLSRLAAHDAAHGFEKSRSIVTNAKLHAGRKVVLRLDLKDFFTSTSAARVEQYFRFIGWSADCATVLTRLCTHNGSLPQGAPTSPRLSNLINAKLDARLAALARKHQANYTRYADDLTFSFDNEWHATVNGLIHFVKEIVKSEGYQLHLHAKLKIQRRHERQRVTGLVVNQRVQLPRTRRRWLRAVEHHVRTGKPATISDQQLKGWRSLLAMIELQRG
jgi:RNA-directed DNA polymerase